MFPTALGNTTSTPTASIFARVSSVSDISEEDLEELRKGLSEGERIEMAQHALDLKHALIEEYISDLNVKLAQAEPPRAAELLIRAVIPKRNREALLGDLDEIFGEDCASFGARRARLRYWGNVLSSLRPLAWSIFKKIRALALLEAARKTFFG
jgi:hypothetical protein